LTNNRLIGKIKVLIEVHVLNVSNEKSAPVLEIHKVAAKWWADWLRGKKKPFNSAGLEGSHALIAEALMGQNADQFESTQINLFEEVLAQKIAEMDLQDKPYPVIVSVDYHPDDTLTFAAKKAGLNVWLGEFPFKTSLWIEGGTIKARVGYSSESKQIYPELN
jgi:hypothetical protein